MPEQLKEIDSTKGIYQFFTIVERKGNVVTFKPNFEGYVSVPNAGIPDSRYTGNFKNSKLPQRELIEVDYTNRVIKWKFASPTRMNSLDGTIEYTPEEKKIFTFPENGPITEKCLLKTERWRSKTHRMIDHYETVLYPNVFQEHSFIIIVLIDLLGEGDTFTKDTFKLFSMEKIPEFKDCLTLFGGGTVENIYFPYLQGGTMNEFHESNNITGKKSKKTVVEEYNKILEVKKKGKTEFSLQKALINSFVGRLMMFKHFSDLIPVDHLNNPDMIWPIVRVYEVPWLRRWLKDPHKLKSFIDMAKTTSLETFKENQTLLLDLIKQSRTAQIPYSQYSQFNNVREAHDHVTILYRRVTNKGGEKEKLFQPVRKKEIAKLKLANKITFEVPKTRADLKGYGMDLNFCIGSYTPGENQTLLAIRKDGKLTYCIQVNRKSSNGIIEEWYSGQFKAKYNNEPDAADKKIVLEGLITNLLNTPMPIVKPKKVKPKKEVKKIAV